MKNIHRINDFALLKFIDAQDLTEFYKIKNELNLDNTQYVEKDNNQIPKIVWESGDFLHKLNKIYSNLALFEPDVNTPVEELKFTNVHFLLGQGFSFESIFGVHVIIKNSKTNEVLISRIFRMEEFYITNNKELIDGSFWLEEVTMRIPTVSDILTCQVTEIPYDDIDNMSGMISNFPQTFILLMIEKLTPDYIKTILTFDENHFLKIRLMTDETKTIEQSLLDYFETSNAVIEVSHVINYGNELYGFATIRVSNEDNKYLPISIGLNLLPYFVGGSEYVNIFVSTEILVDNKLIKRENQINTTLDSINPFIEAQITHPTTNFPVEVIKQNIINQTTIESAQETKLVQVFQPIFAEMITEDIYFQQKNIFFDKITNPAYLRLIANDVDMFQVIMTKTTSDNKFYFDLTEFQPIQKNSIYELVDGTNLKVIGIGKMLVR